MWNETRLILKIVIPLKSILFVNIVSNSCHLQGIVDLGPGSSATMARENPNTEYYTITGACFLVGNGLVSTASVNSEDYFESLGTSNSCHMDLLVDYEYELAYDVLISRQ